MTGTAVRMVDYDIRPGVELDQGDGDEWPHLREQIIASDIVVLVSPTWMGHLTSVAQRALERLDAELSQTGDGGRPLIEGKVAIAGVVGNEDGAHAIVADVFQGLNEWGSAFRRRAARTGTERRCRRSTTKTSTRPQRRSPRPRRQRRGTPRTWRGCCASGPTAPTSLAGWPMLLRC